MATKLAMGPLRGVWLLLMVMAGLMSGCAVSQDQEVQMGLEAAPKFEKEFGGAYPDQEVQAYVNRVGMEVARYAGRPDLPWQFQVLNSDQINAFALPGGYIYITKGLLFRLENEAQLAGILGHESAHIAHRDSVNQLERQRVVQGGTALAGLAAGSGWVGDVGQLVGQLALLKYSREQERNADLAGMDYMLRAGYDPRELIHALEIISKSGDGKGSPEFLSTHPSSEGREEALRKHIETQYANVISTGRTDASRFQQAVLERRRSGGGG